MDCSYIPITDFYKYCLPAAKQNGYRYIISLLAREADVDNLYDTLKKQWVSLDDLTGKDFLFMFAGKYKEHDYNSFVHHNVSWDRNNYGLANEFVSVINKRPSLNVSLNRDIREADWRGRYSPNMSPSREERERQSKREERRGIFGKLYNFEERERRAVYTPDLPENQTKAITELREYFGLTEYDIPCLVFTNLNTGANINVKVDSDKLYKIIKHLYLELETLFRTIDALKSEIGELEERSNSQAMRDHIKVSRLRQELFSFATRLNEEEQKRLIACIENREYGVFDVHIRSRLNSYIDTIKNNDGFVDDVQYIDIEKNKLNHQNNLLRLWERVDSIIFSMGMKL